MKIGHADGRKCRVERSSTSAKTVELSRRELYDLVWSEAVSKVAARYDLSDVGLRKMCIKHRIPLPPRGYWQKVLAGNRVGPIPLPAMPNERKIELRTASSPADRRAETSLYQPAIDAESASPPIVVPAKLIRPHAATDALRDALKGPPDRYGAVHGNTRDAFLVRVHPGSVSRALRIADALAKACEARGFDLKPGKETVTYGSNLQVVVDSFPVCISLNERFRQEAYRASAADLEKERRGRYAYRPAHVFIPTGQFTLKIDPVWGTDVRGSWTDSKARPVEDCLSEVMLSLRKLTIRRRIERAKAEERRARFDEEQRRRAALRATVEAEKKRVETLEIEAAAWQRAENIRVFAAAKAARADPAGDADLTQWLAWAADQADRIDPLRPTPPSILDTPAGDIWPLSSWHC